MPLVRISLRAGKPAAYRRALIDGVYEAMISSFNVPADDEFILVDEYEADNFSYSTKYLGIARSEDLVIVQVTANNTRTLEQKKAFYAKIAANLTANPGLRPEDIFISLVEVLKENWSFGHGIAQYA